MPAICRGIPTVSILMSLALASACSGDEGAGTAIPSAHVGESFPHAQQTPPPAGVQSLATIVPFNRLQTMERGAWPKERAVIERRWLDFLGPLPETKPPLNPRVLSVEETDKFVRQKISYEVERGVVVEAYLLIPRKGNRPFPAVVVFHSTVDYTIRQPAGLEGPEDKHIGVHLAERGYVVLCPQNFIWDYGGAKWMEAVGKLKRDHCDWKGMNKMVWDGIRAVDYLCSLDYVDKNRIGCIGHSLGGKEALFVAAFDPRIKVVVSSEGGIGLKFSNWEAEWYLGPDIRKPDFPLENNQVLALIAPRPFLLIGGDSADGEISLPFILSVKPVYELFGAGDAISFFNHKQGHAYPPEAQKRAYEWIDRWLK